MTHATLKTLAQHQIESIQTRHLRTIRTGQLIWFDRTFLHISPSWPHDQSESQPAAAAGLLRTASRLGLHPPSMPHQRNARTRKKRGVATERGFGRQKSVPKILTTANGPCSHPWPRDFSAPESHFYQLSRTDGRKDVGFRLSRRSLGQISREPRGASRNLSIRLRFSSKWASYLRMRSNKRQSD